MKNFISFLLSQHLLWCFNPRYVVGCGSGSCKPSHFPKDQLSDKHIQISMKNLHLLLSLSIKLQKMLSFRNLKTIIQEINMATTLRDFTIDIWLTFKDHVDMSWSTTSYNSGVPREGSRGRGAWGASPLGMFSVLFWSLFPFKTIMLLKVFYNFTKFLHDFL